MIIYMSQKFIILLHEKIADIFLDSSVIITQINGKCNMYKKYFLYFLHNNLDLIQFAFIKLQNFNLKKSSKIFVIFY